MKWIKKHKWVTAFVLLFIIVAAGAGGLYAKTSVSAAHSHIPIVMNGAKVVVKDNSGKKKELVNPFGDAKKPTEEMVQQYIHGMSHEKVKASEKWVFYKITPQRLQYLIDVVKAYPYAHKALYLSILNRWKKGDFSHAVEDHNAIWRLENGTVGKAERLLTPAEEKTELASKNYH